MPRKRTFTPDAYYRDFPSRLRKLLEEEEKTQQEVADAVGKTRQTIAYYASGYASPDWETIIKIAIFFHVTTDYLLGRTEAKTVVDPGIRAMIDYLGLSEAAIQNLHNEALGQYGNNAIDAILADKCFSDYHALNYTLALAFASCKLAEAAAENRIRSPHNSILENRGLNGMVSIENMAEYDIYRLKQLLGDIVKDAAASVQLPALIWKRYGLDRDPRELLPLEAEKEEGNGPHTED